MKHSKKWCVLVWFLVIPFLVLSVPVAAQQKYDPSREFARTNVCLKIGGFYFPGGVENGQVTGDGLKILQGIWLGSGFIVKSDGTIVTNYHVAQRALAGKAIFDDGSSYDISQIKVYDPVYDLAVLKITAQRQFPAVTLGNSDTVRPMDEVIAVGNPEGMGLNMTKGQVSQVVKDDHGKPRFIRHTAQIAPGSSGGSLNRGREVIGVNVSVRLYRQYGTPTGFNDAIPINLLKELLQPKYSSLHLLQAVFNPNLEYLNNNKKLHQVVARNGQVGGGQGGKPGLAAISGVVLDPLEDYLFLVQAQAGSVLGLAVVDGQNQVIACGASGKSEIEPILFSNEYGQEVSVVVMNPSAKTVNFGVEIYKIEW
jgi:S1-C subfamily serine protease